VLHASDQTNCRSINTSSAFVSATLAMRLVLRHGSKGAAAHNQRCLLRQEFVGGNAGVFGLRIFRITGRG
jgi:hypothetical protein